MFYRVEQNDHFGSIEVRFDGKPSAAVRDALKALKFRWNPNRGIWYGFGTEEATENAIEDAMNGSEPETLNAEPSKKKPVPMPEHGLKVGDLFVASWGWEQTNTNFFQVVELVGKASVRIREVIPVVLTEDATGPMAANYTYKVPEAGELLNAVQNPGFVEDNMRGDLKRVRVRTWKDGSKEVLLKVGKAGHYQTTARPYNGETLYESWYA